MSWRQDPTSVGQTLTHAWAQNLDYVKKLFIEKRKENFLSTANVHDDIHYGSIDMGNFIAGSYVPAFRNLLYNSSFSILSPSRYKQPMGWHSKESANFVSTIYTDESIFGEKCLLLDGTVGTCEVKQKRTARIPIGSLTFSVFFKETEEESTSSDFYEASEAGIILQLEYIDSTVKSVGAGFQKKLDKNGLEYLAQLL